MPERLKVLVAGMQGNLSPACTWALERRGFEPINVQTAEEAIAVAKRLKPPVAIVTGNLDSSPFSKGCTIFDNTNGEKLVEKLREQNPDIKIVAAISSNPYSHTFGDKQVPPNCLTELASATALLLNTPTQAA